MSQKLPIICFKCVEKLKEIVLQKRRPSVRVSSHLADSMNKEKSGRKSHVAILELKSTIRK